ncbi:FAD-dependent oxidoreductase [Polyangium aurulentum]|uniref:FAD-dependent oxidoreductase n=1 Tax=Polyangium aurulentum TaxID=2567896 RepID=UPI0010ADCA49|nr:FAD-dependent oxidoreductase [Polyangium aurulentum]UQA57733.1 FAD-dependent oxidoreductase [Polyangium aurulentum]
MLGERPGAQSDPGPQDGHDHRQTLVVIGNGMTSFKLCQKMVEHGALEDINIVVFGEEHRPAYDRVHLTEIFSGRSEDSLLLAPDEWYEDNDIELILGDRVIVVDRERSIVISASGEIVPYNRLVFATGSSPFVPPVEGLKVPASPEEGGGEKLRPGVFLYRTVDDVYDIQAYASGCLRAAVIGGGLLGLEAAKAVYDLGLKVHVVEVAPGLMPRQLDAPAATLLKEKIEELGVKVSVGKKITRIVSGDPTASPDEPTRLAIQFEDGGELVVDMIIVSTGIRPRGELAQAAGLNCLPNGGIVVDDRLQTSDPQIFAVGECAAHAGTTYGLVGPGYQMVDVLVANLLGGDAQFKGADQSAKLKLMGVTVAALGEFDGDTKPLSSALRYTTGGVYRKLVTRQGRLIGAVTVGDWENLDRIREALLSPVPMNFWDMRRFRSSGNLFPKEESKKVTEWAADAVVCGCIRVTRGTLSACIAEGCSTLAALSSKTGAGTVCGSCKPLMAELLGVDERETVVPLAVPGPALSVREQRPAVSRRGPVSRRTAVPPMPGSMRRPSLAGGPLSVRGGGPVAITAIGNPPTPVPAGRRRRSLPIVDMSVALGELSPESMNALAFAPSEEPAPASTRRPPSSRPSAKSSRPPASSWADNPDAPMRVLPPAPPPEDEAEVGLSSDRAPALFDEPARDLEDLQITPLPPPPSFNDELTDAAARGELELENEEDEDDELGDFDRGESSFDFNRIQTRRSWVPPKRLSMLPPKELVVSPAKPGAQRNSMSQPKERGVGTLLGASIAAALLSAAAAALKPIPVPGTIDGRLGLFQILTDNLLKQVTGYVLVALCALSLVLSLRKRIKRFTFLDVPMFRSIHGVIGALTLFGLVAHTGLHLGTQLNFWLAIDFLAVTVLGAVAGVVTAISGRWSAVTARDRRLATSRLHLWLFFPMPVLVLLHVLQVYYY